MTKDNLAGYHRELVEHFILENKWGRWLGRWTAEENLHAIAIREYLVVTRNFDPAANEDVRVAHVMRATGATTSPRSRPWCSWRSTSAHAVYVRNLEAKVTEPILKGLLGRIAADEGAPRGFFHNLVAHCMEHHRESTIAAIARRGSSLGLVGGDIIEYQDKLKVVADAGVFDLDDSRKVVSDRIRRGCRRRRGAQEIPRLTCE